MISIEARSQLGKYDSPLEQAKPSQAKTCFITDPSIIIQDFFKFSFRVSKVCILFLSQNPPTFFSWNPHVISSKNIVHGTGNGFPVISTRDQLGITERGQFSVRMSLHCTIVIETIYGLWNICERNELTSQN